MRIESVTPSSSAPSPEPDPPCMASRAMALPVWLRPVPEITRWAGSGWSIGGSRRRSSTSA